VLQIKRSVADAWLATAKLDVAGVRAAIDTDLKPRSAALGVTAKGTVDVKTTTATAHNIVGILPGVGALADETVIVGAHYDHLGFGGAGSRAPDSTEVHNGADDNASGVAGVLCSLRALTAAPPAGDRRTLVAMAFSAEESGLGGSSWYVQNPVRPMDKTVAMVNLDMVGRVRDGKLQAMGSDTAPQWEAWLTQAGDAAGLTLGLGGDGYGPSDQTPFYAAGIPVVHFFSGSHEEYHTPADDAPLLNTEGGGQVARLVTELLGTVTTATEGPTYVASTAGPALAGDSRGYGSYLGTIPDYASMGAKEGGVLLSGVREGGPADRAGLKAGDRIVKMGDITIQNLYDMVFVLRDNRPGDTLDIAVVRGDDTIVLKATLDKRPAAPEGGHGGRKVEWNPQAGEDADHLLDPREKHLSELRQLTFGGDNAEAYWSPDGQKLMFQRVPPGGGCDQQFVMDLNTGEVVRVSSGKGRTTCGYYSYPDGDRLIYATTEGGGAECPPNPDHSQGYVWPLYPTFDLVWQDGEKGTPKPFLAGPGYDAEATVCMADGRVVFTSTRSGDLELYTANADGSDLRQLTDLPGYDGGAFFTPDCSEIVWRASRPEGEALADYKALLAKDLVRPSALDLFIMNSDGTNVRQLTSNGAANFGPYPYPDASRIIFSSNMGDSPREFELWSVSRDGGEPERITFSEQFDGFPMFSPDGRHLIFASNRGGKDRETNLFVAKWVP
jgi:Tol biopolymer transport system component